MEESQDHPLKTGDKTNEDILKKFREFGHKVSGTNLTKTISLDSIEKTLYVKYYGKKGEKEENKTKTKKKEKKINIDILIENFLKESDKKNYVPVHIPDLKRIVKYLSEFQEKRIIKSKVMKIEVARKDVKGISWNNQQITEKFSGKIRRKCEELVPTRISQASKVEENIIRAKNTDFGVSKRFLDVTSNTPGPGSYGSDSNLHIPQKPQSKPTSILPSFEWVPERKLKFLDDGLSPTTYCNIHNTIEEKVNKRISKRGPYDTFTGPRDLTTIKNHFALPNQIPSKSWPIKFPGMVDYLQTDGMKYHGRWSKSKRWILVKDKLVPPPDHYQKIELKSFKQNKYPFNNSIPWVWDCPRKTLPIPGPGRYNP